MCAYFCSPARFRKKKKNPKKGTSSLIILSVFKCYPNVLEMAVDTAQKHSFLWELNVAFLSSEKLGSIRQSSRVNNKIKCVIIFTVFKLFTRLRVFYTLRWKDFTLKRKMSVIHCSSQYTDVMLENWKFSTRFTKQWFQIYKRLNDQTERTK